MPETNEGIFDKTLCFEVSIGRLGVRRKVARESVAVVDDGQIAERQPEGEAIQVSKRLLDCPEYDAIVSLDNSFRASMLALALPSVMRRGVYPVPLSLVERVDRAWVRYTNDDRPPLVQRFLDVYERHVDDDRNRLGPLFNSNDYPPISRVRDAFRVSGRWVSYGVPGKLESMSAEIFRRENERAKQDAVRAADDIRDAMRQVFSGLIDSMVDRLTPGPDGKPKIFRNSMIGNLQSFLDTFADRNVVSDDTLSTMVDRARDMLAGASPDDIRKDKSVRQEVTRAVQALRDELNTIGVVTRQRKFALDE